MLTVEPINADTVADQAIEIVERKGIGHPDTICDSIMEEISVALCREYLDRFGTVLHHNVDKGLLAAGEVDKRFGGGRTIRPMRLFIGDRATFSAAGQEVPVTEIAVETSRTWLRRNLRHVEVDADVEYHVLLAPGSRQLSGLFAEAGRVWSANDTSAGVGYYPLSLTESVVLDVEGYLNGAEFKSRFPESGEDVKVMALRAGRDLTLTGAASVAS